MSKRRVPNEEAQEQEPPASTRSPLIGARPSQRIADSKLRKKELVKEVRRAEGLSVVKENRLNVLVKMRNKLAQMPLGTPERERDLPKIRRKTVEAKQAHDQALQYLIEQNELLEGARSEVAALKVQRGYNSPAADPGVRPTKKQKEQRRLSTAASPAPPEVEDNSEVLSFPGLGYVEEPVIRVKPARVVRRNVKRKAEREREALTESGSDAPGEIVSGEGSGGEGVRDSSSLSHNPPFAMRESPPEVLLGTESEEELQFSPEEREDVRERGRIIKQRKVAREDGERLQAVAAHARNPPAGLTSRDAIAFNPLQSFVEEDIYKELREEEFQREKLRRWHDERRLYAVQQEAARGLPPLPLQPSRLPPPSQEWLADKERRVRKTRERIERIAADSRARQQRKMSQEGLRRDAEFARSLHLEEVEMQRRAWADQEQWESAPGVIDMHTDPAYESEWASEFPAVVSTPRRSSLLPPPPMPESSLRPAPPASGQRRPTGGSARKRAHSPTDSEGGSDESSESSEGDGEGRVRRAGDKPQPRLSHGAKVRDRAARVHAFVSRAQLNRTPNPTPLSHAANLQRDVDALGVWNGGMGEINSVVGLLNSALKTHRVPPGGSELATCMLEVRKRLSKFADKGVLHIETALLINEDAHTALRNNIDPMPIRDALEKSLVPLDFAAGGGFMGGVLARGGERAAVLHEEEHPPPVVCECEWCHLEGVPGCDSGVTCLQHAPHKLARSFSCCRTCGRFSPHAATPGRHKGGGPGGGKGEKDCFHCGKPGHVSASCKGKCRNPSCKGASHPGQRCPK